MLKLQKIHYFSSLKKKVINDKIVIIKESA